MLLAAEIILTIIAWIKGWKAKALIPIISALCIGLLIGLNDPSLKLLQKVYIIEISSFDVHLISIVILIIMILNRNYYNNYDFL